MYIIKRIENIKELEKFINKNNLKVDYIKFMNNIAKINISEVRT